MSNSKILNGFVNIRSELDKMLEKTSSKGYVISVIDGVALISGLRNKVNLNGLFVFFLFFLALFILINFFISLTIIPLYAKEFDELTDEELFKYLNFLRQHSSAVQAELSGEAHALKTLDRSGIISWYENRIWYYEWKAWFYDWARRLGEKPIVKGQSLIFDILLSQTPSKYDVHEVHRVVIYLTTRKTAFVNYINDPLYVLMDDPSYVFTRK